MRKSHLIIDTVHTPKNMSHTAIIWHQLENFLVVSHSLVLGLYLILSNHLTKGLHLGYINGSVESNKVLSVYGSGRVKTCISYLNNLHTFISQFHCSQLLQRLQILLCFYAYFWAAL